MGCCDRSIYYILQRALIKQWKITVEKKVDDQVPGNRALGEIRSTNPKTKLKRSGNRDVDELSNVDYVVTNASSSQFGARLYIFWEWSCDQNDHQGHKSYDETRVQNSRSCVRWIVWQSKFGPLNPNLICWYQERTCWHFDQGSFHAWWVEPSSSFVQHHEFLAVFLQLFSFNWKSRTRCRRDLKK